MNVCLLEIKNSDYVMVEKNLNAVTFYLTCVSPQELSGIVGIDRARKKKLNVFKVSSVLIRLECSVKKNQSLKQNFTP